jgi:spore germination protein GerM
MHDQQSRRSIPLGVIAGISAAILVTGSSVAWWSWNSTRNTPEPSVVQPSLPSAPTTTNPPDSATSTTEKSLQIYWLKPSGDEVELATSPANLGSNTDPNAMLESALNQLLEGSKTSTLTTTIPSATKLRSVSIKPNGIHVDLSRQFTTGGGSTSMTGRLAQILYTATSLNPDAKVWLFVEGKPLEILGGEGLVLEQPLTRKSFERDFPL